MIKKIVLTLVLYLCMISVAIAGCIIPSGTRVFIATPNGMMEAFAQSNVIAEKAEKQPTAEQLTQFSVKINEDWSDGIAVKDENGYNVLLHGSDFRCE